MHTPPCMHITCNMYMCALLRPHRGLSGSHHAYPHMCMTCAHGFNALSFRPAHCVCYRPGPRRGVKGSTNEPIISPFASGGLDVRSRALAVAVSACDWAWEYVHYHSRARGCEDYHTSCSVDDPAVACDAVQGYIVTKCLGRRLVTEGSASVTALHLTWSKYHPIAPRVHTVLVHPHIPACRQAQTYPHTQDSTTHQHVCT